MTMPTIGTKDRSRSGCGRDGYSSLVLVPVLEQIMILKIRIDYVKKVRWYMDDMLKRQLDIFSPHGVKCIVDAKSDEKGHMKQPVVMVRCRHRLNCLPKASVAE